jgi:hypothetical protein
MVSLSPTSEASSRDEEKASRARNGYRLGVVIAAASVLVSVALLPFALSSLFNALQHSAGQAGYDVSSPSALRGEWTKLNIATVSMDESTPLITLRVTGFHNCSSVCNGVERVQLFSVHSEPSGAQGSPPSAYIDLPADSSEIDQQVALPIEGKLIDYPFDHYRLLLGVTLSKISANGKVVPFVESQERAGLAYSIDNNIPRVSMSKPTPLTTSSYDTKSIHYDALTSLNFYRPAYLRILTVLLTLLIILAATYGVLFRPFTQIIPTVGGLVLGVWGVRQLLVGSFPPDSTGVDLVLETAILILLLMVAVRAAFFMWPKALFRQKRPPAGASIVDEADE